MVQTQRCATGENFQQVTFGKVHLGYGSGASICVLMHQLFPCCDNLDMHGLLYGYGYGFLY